MYLRAAGGTVERMAGMTLQTSNSDQHGASPGACPINLDVARLRRAVQDEYTEVAADPALLSPDSVLEAFGEGCATLTPRIRARMRQLESGQILEVVTDDPSAREGIPAWSRLTGNTLLATDADDGRLRFSIRKK
jgi:tRNA 2-thiouridine synthesizing protein A